MLKFAKVAIVLSAIALLMLGCSNDPNPVQSPSAAGPFGLAQIADLTPEDVESATLYLFVDDYNGATVNVHRATAAWDESTVTWNSFAGSYDMGIVGSFTPTTRDWYSVDLTDLVKAWMDGTYDNYGVLLEQGQTLYTIYYSSERTTVELRPKLEICYTTPTGTECMTIQRGTEGMVADASIFANGPDLNFGSEDKLYTGLVSDFEKQALLWFELPEPPELAAIGDFVWYDMNQDGIQDEGESGVEGVTVNLYDCQDVMLATMMTDANGYYLFTDLMPGDYYVEFVLPAGWVISPQDQGMDDAMDSDADPATGRTICTTLDAGETDLTWDAGIYMPPQDGCTLTIGYWKAYSGLGKGNQADMVTPLLPIWLGNAGGTYSIPVTDVYIAVDVLVMKTYGDNSNGITKLYAQLLGAKLNVANGASDMAVADVISDADDYLADHDYMAWYGLSEEDQEMILGWKDMLDDYNNGDIGPGHCDDDEDEEEEE